MNTDNSFFRVSYISCFRDCSFLLNTNRGQSLWVRILYLRDGETLNGRVSDDVAGHEMTRVNLPKCGFLFLAYTLFTGASWIEPTPRRRVYWRGDFPGKGYFIKLAVRIWRRTEGQEGSGIGVKGIFEKFTTWRHFHHLT